MRRFIRLFALIVLGFIPIASAFGHWREVDLRAGPFVLDILHDGVLVAYWDEKRDWSLDSSPAVSGPIDMYWWPMRLRLGTVIAYRIPWLWLFIGWILVTASVWFGIRPRKIVRAFPVSTEPVTRAEAVIPTHDAK